MTRVILHEPPAAPTEHDVEDVRDFLLERFASWPRTARIYHQAVGADCDVTPRDEAGIDLLGKMPGPFHVVVYPANEDWLWIFPVAAIVYFGTKAAVEWVISKIEGGPDAPAAGRRSASSSPNNDPFNRANQGRPFSRIPDIFGTVLAVPDLLTTPFKVIDGEHEVEHSYLCVGRGSYDVANIRDGSTPVTQIFGASLQVFGPNTSPNSGAPQLTIGPAISETFVAAKRLPGVDGQTLPPPNKRVTGDDNIAFVWPNVIRVKSGSGFNLAEIFDGDTTITVAGSGHSNSDPYGPLIDVSGTYTISTVSDLQINLSSPQLVNPNWNDLIVGSASVGYLTGTPTLSSTSDSRWVGPFFCDSSFGATSLYANFVAPSGLFKIAADGDDAGKQLPVTVEMEIEITPSTDGVNASGSAVLIPFSLSGSANDKSSRGITQKCSEASPCIVRVRRTSTTDYDYKGSISDDVKFRELYQIRTIEEPHFGDVTTIRYALPRTRAAIYEKERKLNLLATRKVMQRGALPLVASNRVDDILTHALLDPFIGRRQASEVDIAGIYETISGAEDYFGTARAVEFCATLDRDTLSAEEAAASIASAAFCTAYRQGELIKVKFERQTEDSVLLFSRRNRMPDSESQHFRFGAQNDNDGIEFQYIDPTNDDRLTTITLPDDGSAMNPRKIESVGIRNRLQAYLAAQRAWSKMQGQSISLDFEGLEEAELLVQGDRFLYASGLRLDTQQGDVRAQNGLTLTLSHAPTFGAGTHTIFLQLPDGSVDAIPAAAGAGAYDVTLARAPRGGLRFDAAASPTYWLVADDDTRPRAYLLTEKSPGEHRMSQRIQAVNYTDAYYAHDLDYVNGVVDEDGDPV